MKTRPDKRLQGGPGSSSRVIWFDAATPAQVLWFSGLAEALERAGHGLRVTARSHGDTAAIAKMILPRLDAVIEGHHSGGRFFKMAAILRRAAELREWLAAQRPQPLTAISHNSYAQILAARRSGLGVLTAMDFEGQPANHLAFRLAHRVLLPEAYPAGIARRQGATPRKVVRFPGVKEAIYLTGPRALRAEMLEQWAMVDRPLAVVRPEADFAAYQARANPLTGVVIDHLIRNGAHVVVLPRSPDQRRQLAATWRGRIDMPEVPIPGPALLARADLVISAGGTMVREAAVLGTPAYSIFAGRAPAVDRYLEREGRLRILTEPGDVESIEVAHRGDEAPSAPDPLTRQVVLDAIRDFLSRY